MARIGLALEDDNNVAGLTYDEISLEQRFQVKDPYKSKGPFSWSSQQVYGALYDVFIVTEKEAKLAGSGLKNYHYAQSEFGYAQQALAQLPCKAHPYWFHGKPTNAHHG